MALLTLEDIKEGASYSEDILFDKEKIASFIGVSRDSAGIHVDREFSNEKGFQHLVVHGFLISIPFSRILGMELPGENTVIGNISLKFHAPVYLGETVKYTATVKRVLLPLASVLLALNIQKLDGTVCVNGTTTCVFKTKGE
jgi:3-hydroxybutyryl-CoA dehydratase